jgi:hypothetical protein
MIEGHDYTIYSNGPSGRSRMYALLALIPAFLTPLAQHGAWSSCGGTGETTGTRSTPRCSLAGSRRWPCSAF